MTFGLLCCFIVFIVCLSFVPPALHSIFHTLMAQYSLFVLKVPLNSNQPTMVYVL